MALSAPASQVPGIQIADATSQVVVTVLIWLHHVPIGEPVVLGGGVMCRISSLLHMHKTSAGPRRGHLARWVWFMDLDLGCAPWEFLCCHPPNPAGIHLPRLGAIPPSIVTYNYLSIVKY